MAAARARIPLVLAIVALLAVLVAASGGPVETATEGCCGWSWDVVEDEGQPVLAEIVDPAPTPRLADADVGSGMVELLIRIAAVLVVTALGYLLARAIWRTARAVRVEPLPTPASWELAVPTGHEELTDAVEVGLIELSSGPVDDAIVACWVRLEEAAAAAGVARAPWETAAELTSRVLARLRVPEAATMRLLQLYRAARFSDHELGEAARVDAIAALREISDSLAVARTAP